MTVLESGLSVISWLLAIPFILFFTIYVLELIFGLRRTINRYNDASATAVDKPQLAILIPAHNEGSIITQTIAVLRENVPPQTRILVVADNCSDNTADLARKAGAKVVERSDDSNRGKGFALAFGRDQLANDPPDCVIILDADCTLAKGTAAKLASTAIKKSVPVQATNLIYSAAEAPPVVQISNFAMLVKNLVRQRGMTRLGGAALLTGTGMAFPWQIFATAPLANSDLAEDLALGIAITRQGYAPYFLESAGVSSEAAAQEDTLVQRTRWEHGFITTARRHAIPLIASGISRFSRSQFFLGLHLIVPPLALLMAMGMGILLVLACTTFWGSTALPFILLLMIVTAALLLTIAAWLMEGRKVLSFGALIRIPLYVLWKIPVYLKLLRGSENRWIRTRRSGEEVIPDPTND